LDGICSSLVKKCNWQLASKVFEYIIEEEIRDNLLCNISNEESVEISRALEENGNSTLALKVIQRT